MSSLHKPADVAQNISLLIKRLQVPRMEPEQGYRSHTVTAYVQPVEWTGEGPKPTYTITVSIDNYLDGNKTTGPVDLALLPNAENPKCTFHVSVVGYESGGWLMARRGDSVYRLQDGRGCGQQGVCDEGVSESGAGFEQSDDVDCARGQVGIGDDEDG
jgi:hypothetical protein